MIQPIKQGLYEFVWNPTTGHHLGGKEKDGRNRIDCEGMERTVYPQLALTLPSRCPGFTWRNWTSGADCFSDDPFMNLLALIAGVSTICVYLCPQSRDHPCRNLDLNLAIPSIMLTCWPPDNFVILLGDTWHLMVLGLVPCTQKNFAIDTGLAFFPTPRGPQGVLWLSSSASWRATRDIWFMAALSWVLLDIIPQEMLGSEIWLGLGPTRNWNNQILAVLEK